MRTSAALDQITAQTLQIIAVHVIIGRLEVLAEIPKLSERAKHTHIF